MKVSRRDFIKTMTAALASISAGSQLGARAEAAMSAVHLNTSREYLGTLPGGFRISGGRLVELVDLNYNLYQALRYHIEKKANGRIYEAYCEIDYALIKLCDNPKGYILLELAVFMESIDMKIEQEAA